MPTTRAKNRVDPVLVGPEHVETGTDAEPGSAPPPRQSRQRNSARSKTRGARGGGHSNQGRNNPEKVHEDVEEEVYFDDEEPDIGKTLHSKDGKLGFITSKGFVCATNFVVDIASQVHSIKYVIKGYEVLVKKVGADSWVDFFIPEADIYNPVRLV